LPLENGEHYKDLREWVDNEVWATFHKRNATTELAPPLMQDVVRVVERVFPYAMTSSVRDANGTPITPEYLINEVGFGKLKIVSSQFIDTDNNEHLTAAQKAEKRDKLLLDLTQKSARELRKEYSTPRIPIINYALNIAPTGASDIIMTGLSPTQVELIRTSLGRMVQEHAIHISEADREALFTLLTPEMQNTYEIEGDE